MTPEPTPRRGTIDRLLRTAAAIASTAALAACAASRTPALPTAPPDALGLSPAALDRIDPALRAGDGEDLTAGTPVATFWTSERR